MADVMKVATFVPVSTEVLADVAHFQPYIAHEYRLWATARFFDEDWHSVRGEMERLELGTQVRWDDTFWDYDEEEW